NRGPKCGRVDDELRRHVDRQRVRVRVLELDVHLSAVPVGAGDLLFNRTLGAAGSVSSKKLRGHVRPEVVGRSVRDKSEDYNGHDWVNQFVVTVAKKHL